MTKSAPFQLPKKLPDILSSVHDYWRGLIRGKASDIPYWDDVDLSAIPSAADNMMLMTAFAKPERIRFDIVGKIISTQYGHELTSSFADEITPKAPLNFLLSQASAAIEGQIATYYEDGKTARLILPLWGDGHVSMLLGAVAEVK